MGISVGRSNVIYLSLFTLALRFRSRSSFQPCSGSLHRPRSGSGCHSIACNYYALRLKHFNIVPFRLRSMPEECVCMWMVSSARRLMTCVTRGDNFNHTIRQIQLPSEPFSIISLNNSVRRSVILVYSRWQPATVTVYTANANHKSSTSLIMKSSF